METTPDRQRAARDYAEQALTTQDRLEAELRELRQRCATLYDAVAHGDDRHRAWLRAAVDAHMASRPVPAVDGQGAREALAAEVRQLKDAHEHLLRRNAVLVVQAQEAQEACELRRDNLVLKTTMQLMEPEYEACRAELLRLSAENEGLRRQVEDLRRELVQTMRESPDA